MTIFANIKEAFVSGYRFSLVDMVGMRSLVFSCSTEGLLLDLKRLQSRRIVGLRCPRMVCAEGHYLRQPGWQGLGELTWSRLNGSKKRGEWFR